MFGPKKSEKGLNLFPEPTWRSSNVLLDPQPKDFKFTVIGDDAKTEIFAISIAEIRNVSEAKTTTGALLL